MYFSVLFLFFFCFLIYLLKIIYFTLDYIKFWIYFYPCGLNFYHLNKDIRFLQSSIYTEQTNLIFYYFHFLLL